jgi:hypothetical protein
VLAARGFSFGVAISVARGKFTDVKVVFLISIAMHALVFVSLPAARLSPPPPSASTVELVETPTSTSTQNSKTKSASKAASDSPAKISRDLLVERDSKVARLTAQSRIRFAPSFLPPSQNSSTSDLDLAPKLTADGDVVDDPAAEWGSGGAQFSRVKDLGRFDRLYDFIDAHVMYPSVLAYHHVEGTVNARLVLTSRGACDWHATKIESTQAHLRLYVLDVLKRVCSHNLVRYARKSANSNLDLSFKFAVTEHDDERLKAREKKVVGNVFLFYRNTQASIAEWHLGPFHGIFPVPVVALDFTWLQENYDRVMHSRDPLKEFKSHLSEDPPS